MKRCVVFAVMMCLNFTTASRAMPPGRPGTVTIDGIPCSRLCQVYMEWLHSLRSRSARDSSDMPSRVAAAPAAKPKPSLHDRLAKPRVARPNANRPASIAKLPARLANSLAAATARPADTSCGKPFKTPDTGKPQTNAADDAQVSPEASGQAQTSGVEMANARQADERSSHAQFNADANALPRSIRAQLVAAAAVAEQLTPAIFGSPEATSATGHEAVQSTEPNARMLVALVISHPEIKSVSELTGRTIAIDDRQSASEARVTAALVAAGAAEVQLRDGATTAIDRLLRGEVPAAVVTVVSPEAAAAFPDIAGFHVFKIPLAPQ